MRIFSKFLISLAVSLFVAAGLAVLAYGGLFNFVEMKFYQPAVLSSAGKILDAQASAFGRWQEEADALFEEYASRTAVRRSFVQNQENSDIEERAVLTSELFSALGGLKGIRILDSGAGVSEGAALSYHRIHFSTFEDDVISRRNSRIAYKNYEDTENAVPFDVVARSDNAGRKVSADPATGVLIFSFPIYDSYSVWRGTIAFYVSPQSAENNLIEENLLRIGDRFTVVAADDFSVGGIVRGFPDVLSVGAWNAGDVSSASLRLSAEIASQWTGGGFSAERAAVVDGVPFVLCSRPLASDFFISALIPETFFEFSNSAKVFFLCAGFITVFLILFFILCLKQDALNSARRRVRTFQFQLLRDVIASGRLEDGDGLRRFCEELSARRREFSAEIKSGFGKRLRKKYSAQLNELVDKSWDEILSALGNLSKRAKSPSADLDALKKMMEQVLSSVNLGALASSAKKTAPAKAGGKDGAQGEIEEFGSFEKKSGDNLDAKVEKLGEVGELTGAESPAEVEELSEVEELDEVEELSEAEELEEIEELSEAEELEEVEELSEVEELEEVEELSEVEELEEVEELSEVEELEEVEELSEVEELDEVEELSEVEELDEVEELSEVEELDEVEEFSEVEDLEEVEELSEADEVEEVEELSEVGELSEVEELDEVEELSEAEELDEVEELSEVEELEEVETLAEAGELEEVSLDEFLGDEASPAKTADAGASEEEVSLDEFLGDDSASQVVGAEHPASGGEAADIADDMIFQVEGLPDDTGKTDTAGEAEEIEPLPVKDYFIAGLDFSMLDTKDAPVAQDDEDVLEPEYLGELPQKIIPFFPFAEASAMLDVVGDEEPAELLPVDVLPDGEDGAEDSIVNRNGIYVIDSSLVKTDTDDADSAFKQLVDSVLL